MIAETRLMALSGREKERREEEKERVLRKQWQGNHEGKEGRS